MKVAMITPFYYPVIGGTESQIENLSLKLNGMRISADIVTFNFDRSMKPIPFPQVEKINGLKVTKVATLNYLPTILHHNKINFMINFIPRKLNCILNEYDVLHFHNEVDLTLPAFSYRIRRPKVFHLRCLSVTYPIFRRNFVCRYLLKKIADIYIAQSKYVFRLLSNLGIDKKKIEVIPNAIDVSLFEPKGQKAKNRLLYVGRIEKYKGLHVLLKALKLVHIPVELLIIGPMSKESSYKQKIMSLIAELREKTSHKVDYLGPKKFCELLSYYQSASIVVIPSLNESFGNVILESLACETPVIASSVGGIPEIVRNYENGILVPPNNYIKLAEAIQHLLKDEKLRQRLGKQGRNIVVDNFSIDVIAHKILYVYDRLLSNF
jgi:glycosyltransferase involved in cell wall biosynthesis